MVISQSSKSSDVRQDLKICLGWKCRKLLKSKHPQSPLVFFLTFCSYILYVPFGVTWNTSTNCFTLVENKVRKLCCGIVHTLVFAYHIIILLDHIQNFNEVSRSIISECFLLLRDCTSTILWLSFTKIVWYNKHQLKYILNSLTSNMFSRKQLAIIKSAICGIVIIYMYSSYNFSYKNLDLSCETNESHVKYTEQLPLWTSKHYVLITAQLYVMLFYFIVDSFIFALNCPLLENAWKFRKELLSIENHNMEQVFIVSLTHTHFPRC